MQFCTTDNSDAQYAVAKAKYDTYSGAAKDNCLEKAKADFWQTAPRGSHRVSERLKIEVTQ